MTKCKKCNKADGNLYGFCSECFEDLRIDVGAALTNYEEDKDSDPHDLCEELAIFDELICTLWKIFKA